MNEPMITLRQVGGHTRRQFVADPVRQVDRPEVQPSAVATLSDQLRKPNLAGGV